MLRYNFNERDPCSNPSSESDRKRNNRGVTASRNNRSREKKKKGRMDAKSPVAAWRGDGRRRIERREMISIGSLRRPCKRIIGQ